jgi:hypothetical protein
MQHTHMNLDVRKVHSLSKCATLLALEILPQRMSIVAVDINLGKHIKCHMKIFSNVLLDFLL